MKLCDPLVCQEMERAHFDLDSPTVARTCHTRENPKAVDLKDRKVCGVTVTA